MPTRRGRHSRQAPQPAPPPGPRTVPPPASPPQTRCRPDRRSPGDERPYAHADRHGPLIRHPRGRWARGCAHGRTRAAPTESRTHPAPHRPKRRRRNRCPNLNCSRGRFLLVRAAQAPRRSRRSATAAGRGERESGARCGWRDDVWSALRQRWCRLRPGSCAALRGALWLRCVVSPID